MRLRPRYVLYALVLNILAYAFLLWGVPFLVRVAPDFCGRWQMSSGVCRARVIASLQAMDAWTSRTIRPFSESELTHRALDRAQVVLFSVEQVARTHVGADVIDRAMRGVDIAVEDLERILMGQRAGEKLRAVPQRAAALLRDTRVAVDRLRTVLVNTQQTANNITNAVGATQRTLDALRDVLPRKDEERR